MRLSFSYRLSDGLLLCQSLGSTGDIRCSLSLSPRGFQLPTFCAGWFSTANLSCWLVLIGCSKHKLLIPVSLSHCNRTSLSSAILSLSCQSLTLVSAHLLQPGLSLCLSLSCQSLTLVQPGLSLFLSLSCQSLTLVQPGLSLLGSLSSQSVPSLLQSCLPIFDSL